MLYMFLLHHDPSVPPAADILDRHFAFVRPLIERGAYICSEAIGGTEQAATVRVRDGKPMVTDGPFSETKEVMGGFYIIDCKDREEALRLAAQIPDAATGIEVRPVMGVPGWPYTTGADRVRQPMGVPAA